MAQETARRTTARQAQPRVAPRPQIVTGATLQARLLPHALVLLAAAVLTAVATWPLLPDLGGYVVNKLDPLYSVWAMAWQAHALGTNPAGLFDTNIMYPFKGTLAFDELSFAQAVISAPLYWISGNPVLSHNVQLFLTFVLSAYGMWLLVRELTHNSLAGLVAGAAFAFSMYRMDHLPHLTLLSTEWLPFLLLAAYKLLWSGSWKWAAALGVFFILQALSSHYLAFYSVILLGLFALYYWLVERPPHAWALLGKAALALVASAAIMFPVMLPYVNVQAGHEFTRGLFEVERYSNTLASFLSVYQANPVLRALLAPFADPGPWPWERSAFPGFTVLILAVVGLLGARRVPRPGTARGTAGLAHHAYFFGLVALLASVLSLGPTLQLTYAPSSYDPTAINGVVPLPYMALHDFVPGFASMRVVARIGVLVALSLAALAGIGSVVVLAWLSEKPRLRAAKWALPLVAGLLVLLPVAESWSAPVSLDPIGTRSAVPPVYGWLAAQPRTVVLEYPMTLDVARRGPENVAMQNTYQYYSAYHWQNLVNGSTTIRPPAYSALVHETEDCFPCPRSLDALWALGVRYVVVHLDNLTDAQRTEFLWRATSPEAKVADDFSLVKEFGSDRVYELLPRQLGQINDVIPPGASVLLADPQLDRIRVGNDQQFIGGGYVAALGWMLRDHPMYGDPGLAYGETVLEPDAESPPDYAILWARQDPNTAGYLEQNRVWANEFVAVYKRGPGKAAMVSTSPTGGDVCALP